MRNLPAAIIPVLRHFEPMLACMTEFYGPLQLRFNLHALCLLLEVQSGEHIVIGVVDATALSLFHTKCG